VCYDEGRVRDTPKEPKMANMWHERKMQEAERAIEEAVVRMNWLVVEGLEENAVCEPITISVPTTSVWHKIVPVISMFAGIAPLIALIVVG
jgi:hypothetical protein